MVNKLFLVISITLIHCSYSIDLPKNLYEADVTKIIKEIKEKSQNGDTPVSLACAEQFGWFKENLQTFDDGMWALKMVDSTGKISSGILGWNVAWLGSFDGCLAIESTKHDVKGKYCLASLGINIPTPINLVSQKNISKQYKKLSDNDQVDVQVLNWPALGLCIPDKCTEADIKTILTSLISLEFSAVCQTKDNLNKPLDTGAILTICYLSTFIVLMVLSTIYDLYCTKLKSNSTKPHPLLIAFSIYTNGIKLFATHKNSGEFSCLHGIRFLSMLWVIAGHHLIEYVTGPLVNLLDLQSYMQTQKSMIFINGVYSVDTFFVVTGFLVVYGFMKSAHQGHKFNIIIFYLHRYIRLTPALIPVILAKIFLIPYLGSGPYYPQLISTIQVCRDHWWSTILYIQNYVNVEKMCLGHTWYLNIDMQLYVIAPIFLLFLPKRPVIGLALMLCATIGVMIGAFMTTWNNQLPAVINSRAGDVLALSSKYYMKTHTRAATWFIGGFLGYILGKIKNNSKSSLELPKWLIAICWIIALTVIPICIFAGFDDLTSTEYHPYSAAFYNTFARNAWGICIAWIIFACSVGYGGFINSFLSLPVFQVLGRFTYSMYLVHNPITYVLALSQKQPVYYTLFNMVYSFWSLFALCLGISILWVLAFESPILAIEKYLLGNKAKRSNESPIKIRDVASTETIITIGNSNYSNNQPT